MSRRCGRSRPSPWSRGGRSAAVAFVPRSRTLIVSGQDFLAGVDTGEGHRVTPLTGHRGTVLGPTSVSADGRRMATIERTASSCCGRCSPAAPVGPPRPYYPSGSRRRVAQPRRPDARVGYSRESASSSSTSRTLRVARSWPTPRTRSTSLGSARTGATSSPPGPAAGSAIWSAETARPVGQRLRRAAPRLSLRAAVSPDGRTLATGSIDGTVRLFDVQSRRPLGVPLPGLPNRPVAPLFTPDGAHLLAVPYGDRPTAGTCGRRRGRGRRARWPGARSRAPSGPTCCRAATTRPPAVDRARSWK